MNPKDVAVGIVAIIIFLLLIVAAIPQSRVDVVQDGFGCKQIRSTEFVFGLIERTTESIVTCPSNSGGSR